MSIHSKAGSLLRAAALCALASVACDEGAGTASEGAPVTTPDDDADEEMDGDDDAEDRPDGRPPRSAPDAARAPSLDAGKRDAGAKDAMISARDAESLVRDAAPDRGEAADADIREEPVVCPTMKLTPGSHEDKVAFGGHDRRYLLYVPKGYTGATPIPLVFDFHGYGQSVTSQKNASGFAELADEHGFAVVYPAGVGGSWHVNGCCGQAAQEKLDEVGAVRALLAQVRSTLCVDAKRIYASGISQGGGMAHHVGCLAADVFAAIAPVSSDLRTEPCMPSRPISELSFRGMADALSAYEGGPVGPAGMQYQSIGAKETLERWKTINACTGTPKVTHELCETYTECAEGVEVTLCSIPRGGHGLYSNPERFDLAQVAWEMFSRQRLP